jgi:hypothetical protein
MYRLMIAPWAETCSDAVQLRYVQWNVSELFGVCFCCVWRKKTKTHIRLCIIFPISNSKFNQLISPLHIQYYQGALLSPSHVRPFHWSVSEPVIISRMPNLRLYSVIPHISSRIMKIKFFMSLLIWIWNFSILMFRYSIPVRHLTSSCM